MRPLERTTAIAIVASPSGGCEDSLRGDGGTTDQVWPGLWLGSMADAIPFPGPRLSVASREEYRYTPTDQDANIPFLAPGEVLDGPVANLGALDTGAAWLAAKLHGHPQVLVHCFFGKDRSPFAAAWFLHRQAGMEWEEAWRVVQSKHRESSRWDWLPHGLRL